MKIEDFISVCDDNRPQLRKPFKQGDYIYASNGKMAVRKKSSADFDTDDVSEVKMDILPWDDFNKEWKWTEVPAVTKESAMMVCRTCKGKKFIALCPECNGEGDIECNLGHMHDCERCNRKGIVDDGKLDTVCDRCDGVGTEHSDSTLLVGRQLFLCWQLYLIQSVFGKITIADKKEMYPIPFKVCDDIEGLIMPTRRD